MNYKQKISEAILGVAIGDAVGVPVEFLEQEYFKEHPVTDMLGGENTSHGQPAGTWSDDTSMTLALVDALSQSKDEPDYDLTMQNFEKWLSKCEYSPWGEVFDVGRTCFTAIGNYARHDYDATDCGPKGEYDCGNGALMKILPAVFWEYKTHGEHFIYNWDAIDEIDNLTSLTHGHIRCTLANEIYLSIAGQLLAGKDKTEAIKTGYWDIVNKYHHTDEKELAYIREFREIASKDENSGVKSSGYVVDTLEAALWAFRTTDSYKDCVLKAVNLGNDTDTTAAVAGGLAGLYYGIGGKTGIPLEWLDKLVKLEYIVGLCDKLAKRLED